MQQEFWPWGYSQRKHEGWNRSKNNLGNDSAQKWTDSFLLIHEVKVLLLGFPSSQFGLNSPAHNILAFHSPLQLSLISLCKVPLIGERWFPTQVFLTLKPHSHSLCNINYPIATFFSNNLIFSHQLKKQMHIPTSTPDSYSFSFTLSFHFPLPPVQVRSNQKFLVWFLWLP